MVDSADDAGAVHADRDPPAAAGAARRAAGRLTPRGRLVLPVPIVKHAREIPRRPRFTIGKIEEELEELKETDERAARWHATIEAADLINATYSFLWRKYRVPPLVVIVVSLVTSIYKPVVRWIKRK